MTKAKTLSDLFHDTLKDIYFAEKKIMSALPKMAKAAQNDELRAAFEKHLEETEGQVERLESVFEEIGAKVKKDDWNDYVVEAVGPKVKIWINGKLVCDIEDAKLARRGVIGLQVHSGGPTEVRFKELKLEVLK